MRLVSQIVKLPSVDGDVEVEPPPGGETFGAQILAWDSEHVRLVWLVDDDVLFDAELLDFEVEGFDL